MNRILWKMQWYAGRLIRDERGEVNIVAIVVLMGIAVSLALIFKDEITKLLKDLFVIINGKSSSAVGAN